MQALTFRFGDFPGVAVEGADASASKREGNSPIDRKAVGYIWTVRLTIVSKATLRKPGFPDSLKRGQPFNGARRPKQRKIDAATELRGF